jgi:hypothetical protein
VWCCKELCAIPGAWDSQLARPDRRLVITTAVCLRPIQDQQAWWFFSDTKQPVACIACDTEAGAAYPVSVLWSARLLHV